MPDLFSSSLRAIRSLFAPGMLGTMVVCVLVAILVLFGFASIMSMVVSMLSQSQLMAWMGSIGSFVLAWFLFPGIMPVIVNFFGERIMVIIEQQDYPQTVSRPSQFWPEFWHDARFSLMTVFLNILVLPLYLLPVINLFLFYLLNGWLLGREFFVMAARRHLAVEEAENLRKRYGRTVLIGGIVLTVLATIPIVNLFAPFWGIAMMTHLYHRLAGQVPVIESK